MAAKTHTYKENIDSNRHKEIERQIKGTQGDQCGMEFRNDARLDGVRPTKEA